MTIGRNSAGRKTLRIPVVNYIDCELDENRQGDSMTHKTVPYTNSITTPFYCSLILLNKTLQLV